MGKGEKNIYIYIIHQKKNIPPKHFTNILQQCMLDFFILLPLVQSIFSFLLFYFQSGLSEAIIQLFTIKKKLFAQWEKILKRNFPFCFPCFCEKRELWNIVVDVLLWGDQSKINNKMRMEKNERNFRRSSRKACNVNFPASAIVVINLIQDLITSFPFSASSFRSWRAMKK